MNLKREKKQQMPREIRREIKGVSLSEILIPAGTFVMGSPKDEIGRFPDEKQHNVRLTRSFYMGQTPVTQKQFQALMNYQPSFFASFKECEDCPVESVNWHQAAAFCNALSRATGLPECFDVTGSGKDVEAKAKKEYYGKKYYNCPGYRLPTEAEWEYAYRAGTTTAFYNGDIHNDIFEPCLDDIAWYGKNSDDQTHPVGLKEPNSWGLYDMSGNVAEWVFDYARRYKRIAHSKTEEDPLSFRPAKYRIYRGGSYYVTAWGVRAALRGGNHPHYAVDYLGFRFARTSHPDTIVEK